jgi:hypothetical protein
LLFISNHSAEYCAVVFVGDTNELQRPEKEKVDEDADPSILALLVM